MQHPIIHPLRKQLILRRIFSEAGLACVLGLLLLATEASQAQSDPDNEPAATSLDELVVVGSRAEDRSLLDSAVPVTVFSGEELRATGAVGNELGQALAILSPSFNFPRQSNSVTSDHTRAAQLRGLSPDQVLVLINGKRRHTSATVNDNTKIGRGTNAVDFNTIPLTAIKRVEILLDGASAQYGSDAIAGVINIILDDDPSGGEAAIGYGLHYTDVEPLDRTVTDGQTVTAHINNGNRIGEQGFIRYGAELHARSATNRAGRDNVPPFFIIPQTPDNLALAGQQTHRVGDPESDGINLWLNAEGNFEQTRLYGFGTFSYRETEGAAVYRYPDDDQNVRALYPDGFLPRTTGDNHDLGITVGYRRLLAGWDIDNSLTWGRNRFEFGVENSLNASLGPDSPTRFDSGSFNFDQINLNFDARRSFNTDLIASPVNVAAGIAYRYESYDSEAGDPASFTAGDFTFQPELADIVGRPAIGAQGAQGLSPADEADENRDVFALYTDVSSQLTRRLFLGLAARLEHYSDFGSTLTGKLSGSYALSPTLSARGSLSNSFRAPSLSQIGLARRTTSFGPDGDRIAARLVRADSPVGQALGAQSLEEEQAVNASLGLAADLGAHLDLTVDIFQINVDDRITLSESLEDDGTGITSLTDVIQSLPGGEDVESVAFFTNAVDTQTRGIEIVAEYQHPLANGEFGTTASYSYADTEITSIDAPPGQLQAINPSLVLVGVEEINTIEEATPKHQFILSSTWTGGAWRLLGRLRHYSSAVREFSFARQRFGAETAFDTEITYQASQRVALTLGARNLFDNYPDLSNPANNFFGNFAYDILSPIGINGRYLYTRATLTF